MSSWLTNDVLILWPHFYPFFKLTNYGQKDTKNKVLLLLVEIFFFLFVLFHLLTVKKQIFFDFQTQGLTTALTTSIMSDIQRSIRQKDEEMSWLDACCLHFAIKGKTKTETYTFQTRDPNVKKEWIVGKPLLKNNLWCKAFFTLQKALV